MIVIKNLHGGRFGNKVLHYNNLVQIAKFLDIDYNCVAYEPYTKLNLKNNFNSNGVTTFDINAKVINNLSKENLKDFFMENYKGRLVNLTPCLGELFFKFDHDTREIFNIPKVAFNPLPSLTTNIGIHFRGGDFHTWNPESILDKEYYINCIEDTLTTDSKYYLFTDDKSLPSYNQVIQYLKEKDINFELGFATEHGGDFLNDYKQLCDTDIIISSPSTFAICAGFMGREKECYHSKKWVDSRVKANDSFWVDLKKNLNKNYILKNTI